MQSPRKSSQRRHADVGSAPQNEIRAPRRRLPTPPDETARDSTSLTIGKLAKLTEISTDTLRFYEDQSLLIPAGKTEAGYRLYGQDAVRRLDFIRHAQHCGMTLSEIRQLLELRADDNSCCSDVRSLAIRKKLQLEHKIKTMQAMSQALSELIDICTAENQPLDDCPILAALESSIAKQNHDPH
ncbi:heavy metal-responsive transcriptional regulator [Paralcaligenes ureilyticus]|uniref:MerR family transcriptional regulator n=1 Tax=Paralcaligenes ureilyticus TaxID=627131 RepID=A0A4R3M6A6_9BURK|nr:heavy metal-responsive transcriptional regulator [Paralcaligenes ureilyticus]TCT07047.1 MerR family transcriptional regulator [Paralcaligenes ureilyticus]